MIELLQRPWPWYICGPLIGLTVPLLLIIGNKTLGVSSSLRDICAACLPADLSPWQYNWKNERWNLFFTAGILFGGIIAATLLSNGHAVEINPQTRTELVHLGVRNFDGLLPSDIFSVTHVLSVKGFFFFIIGGFLVGFGTRYAGGCTSGHTIMGLSSLQLPSLVATICFMIGGLLSTHYVLPFILSLF